MFYRKKIAESHLTESPHGRIVELAKLHDAERHFSESLFNRTSFSRIVVQPNVSFTNHRSAERRFPETSFARTSFCRNCMKQTAISPNTKKTARVYFCSMCSNWVRAWTCLNMDTVRIRKVWNSGYGRFNLTVVFVPLIAYSGKWCSAKRRFGKMAFG